MNQTVRPLPQSPRIGASACPHDCPSTCALEDESRVLDLANSHGVTRDRGKIGDERAEAVDGQAVVGALGCDLAFASSGTFGFRHDRSTCRFGRGSVVIVEKDGLEDLPHVPFDIVRERAQQHVSTNALGAAMMDRPDFEIDRLETSERALHSCEILVGPDGSRGIEDCGLDVGA